MTVNLFASSMGHSLYNQLRRDDVIWHKTARDFLNEQYNQNKKLLDEGFPKKFPAEFLRCLWELKLLRYLTSIKQGNLLLSTKDKIKLPDFKWIINEKTYYFEAISPTKGSTKNYPYLNTQLSGMPPTRDGTIGHREYRERITGAFREKAVCNYNPYVCDMNACNHNHRTGYKTHIEGNGYIIAISMADIDFMNQPMNWRVDLSCFFPISPYMTMDINRAGSIQDIYHSFCPSFNKGNKKESPINVDIFGSAEYSHVSAVIISRHWPVLFPKLSQHEPVLSFDSSDNDFMLIHNPYAIHKLPPKTLPVESEFIAGINGDTWTIQNVKK